MVRSAVELEARANSIDKGRQVVEHGTMRSLRDYVTIEIEFAQWWYDVRTRWNNRTEWQRTQRRWDDRVASWHRDMDEFDKCERLRAASDLSFAELLDFQMLLMRRDIRRDFRRKFFGDGPAKGE